MSFMLLLLGIVLTAVICTAREIVKGWRRVPEGRRLSVRKKRDIRSISVKECETLVRASADILFVVVRQSGERRQLPFPEMHAFAVTPPQLAHELRWIPRSTCVVVCGEVNLCSSALESLEDVPGAAPIYVLKDSANCREVA